MNWSIKIIERVIFKVMQRAGPPDKNCCIFMFYLAKNNFCSWALVAVPLSCECVRPARCSPSATNREINAFMLRPIGNNYLHPSYSRVSAALIFFHRAPKFSSVTEPKLTPAEFQAFARAPRAIMQIRRIQRRALRRESLFWKTHGPRRQGVRCQNKFTGG